MGLRVLLNKNLSAEAVVNGATGLETYSKGIKLRMPNDFLMGLALSLQKMFLVTGEDCTAGFDVVFPEVLEPLKHFLCALPDTLLWTY